VRIDHLLFTVPDLEDGTALLSELLGVEPVRGGRYPNLGTANAVVGLGSESYLEITGPDAASTDPGRQEYPGMAR
jgi:catechol 2,3-dioxygenase-like lactoylglutathione lyase family enzyme